MPGAFSRISRRSSAVSRSARSARRSACRRQPSAGSSAPSRAKRSRSLPSVATAASRRQLGVDLRRPGRRRPGHDGEARVRAADGAAVRRQPRAIDDPAHGARGRHVGERLRILAAGDPDDAGALAHELAHARVLPGRPPVERVLGRAERAGAGDARIGLEHVDVARTRAVSRLGERDRELALDRLGVHGEHVAGSDQQPVTHDRIGVTGERAGVHAAHRSAAGIVQRVDLDLSDEHRLFRDTVRGFAEGVVAPVAEELDAHGRFPLAELRQAAELGLLGVPDPGGRRRRGRRHARLRALHRGAGARRLLVRDHGRGAHLARDDADPALRRRARSAREWLPRLASGERLAAFGLTEPEAGSDAGATRTTARAEDGEWVIDGSKMFITNAGTEISGCVTITARTGEDEISNFIVPNGTPGYDVGPPLKKMGWKSSDTRPLAFSGCRIPSDNLLGPRGEGLHQFLTILDGGRISVAALGLGLAQGAYELALAYARTRQQFGRAIARFQAVQFKLADMATEIAAGARADLPRRLAQGPRPAVRARGLDGQAVHGRARLPRGRRGRADPRRLRLHGRVRRSRASTATPRSSRSARARTRSSAS